MYAHKWKRRGEHPFFFLSLPPISLSTSLTCSPKKVEGLVWWPEQCWRRRFQTILGKILNHFVISDMLVYVLFAFIAMKFRHPVKILDSIKTLDVLVILATIKTCSVKTVFDLGKFWNFDEFLKYFRFRFSVDDSRRFRMCRRYFWKGIEFPKKNGLNRLKVMRAGVGNTPIAPKVTAPRPISWGLSPTAPVAGLGTENSLSPCLVGNRGGLGRDYSALRREGVVGMNPYGATP
ncbi:hypothetical protein Sjap_024001 [Stephania japonica]|uniref:Uncharacterized protein n=1 Tax=Stephania japonica TaxID=461633 RepID=A0AAP0HL32_9MAGN